MASVIARIGTLAVAAAVGGGAVWMLSTGKSAEVVPAAAASTSASAPVQSADINSLSVEVGRMPAAERVRLGGYVEARDAVQLTAQTPGRVTFVGGQEGDRVRSGEVVIALDDDSLQPQYRAAWAKLAGEMAQTQNAQTQLYQKLYGRSSSPLGGPAYAAYEKAAVPFYNMAQGFMGMVPGMGGSAPLETSDDAQHSPAVINAARAEYEGQLAALAGAQAQIDLLDAQARDKRSVAPWDGAIMARHVRVGDIVQPGQPLVDLADVDHLDVRIEVPVAQVSNLKLGDQVPVTLDGKNLWAPVSQIFPGAADGQRTVSVKLALPADTKAAPGMYALAWIAQPGGGSPSALAPAVPTSSIVRRGSLPVAFVVDGSGKVEMRVLRLGDEQGSNTAVLSGVTFGERVVADPSADLKSGDTLGGQKS